MQQKRKRVNLSFLEKEMELFSFYATQQGEKLATFIKKLAITQLKKKTKCNEEIQGTDDSFVKNSGVKTRINLTLPEKEKEWFSFHASKRGEKLAPFVRKLAVAQLKKQNKYIPTDEEQESIKELVKNLRAIGNNINQIAHVANIYKKSSKINFIRLRKKVSAAEKLITDYFSRRID